MDRLNTLEELICQEITGTGPITFARYMELALYHPTLGYYSGGEEGHEPVGWSGDYFTSGDVHPLWGQTIARQLHQMWELLGKPHPFEIVEPGAGRGLLARDVCQYAAERAPDWAQALRYTLVDRARPDSPLWMARQKRLWATLDAIHLPANMVRMISDLEVHDPPEGFTGCVVSNELVDSLPTHILQKQGDSLAEVFVTVDGSGRHLIETLSEPSSPETADYLDRFGIPWREYPEFWRCEVCLAARAWLLQAAARLRRGYVLTIDYGSTARDLYTPGRRRGTLVAYARHQMNESPLAQPGLQDITAHVNFTELIDAGRDAGLETLGLTSQAEFLGRLGIREEARRLASHLYPYADTERHTDRGQSDYLRQRTLLSAVSILLDPGGLGAFQVLVQQRQVPPEGRDLLGLMAATPLSPEMIPAPTSLR